MKKKTKNKNKNKSLSKKQRKKDDLKTRKNLRKAKPTHHDPTMLTSQALSHTSLALLI
jgi:hypothetical protein